MIMIGMDHDHLFLQINIIALLLCCSVVAKLNSLNAAQSVGSGLNGNRVLW